MNTHNGLFSTQLSTWKEKKELCRTSGYYSGSPLQINHQATIFGYKEFEEKFFNFKIMD